MSSMRIRVGFLVSTVLGTVMPAFATSVHGQIEPGRIYGSGAYVADPASGLSLTMPDGWQGALAPDGSAFVMESQAGDGYIFVIGEEASEAEVRSELTGPIDLGDGIVLRPAGPVEEIAADHLSAPFSVEGGGSDLSGQVDVRLTPSGAGVAFILVSSGQSRERHLSDMRGLARDLGIAEPASASSPTTEGQADDAWQPYLRGRYLARFFSGSSYTESTEIWLCSDGTFYFDDQGGGYGGGASGAIQSRGGGSWSATGAGRQGTLILQWSDGSRSSWPLEYDYEEDRLYLNGERWLRGDNERCS